MDRSIIGKLVVAIIKPEPHYSQNCPPFANSHVVQDNYNDDFEIFQKI